MFEVLPPSKKELLSKLGTDICTGEFFTAADGTQMFDKCNICLSVGNLCSYNMFGRPYTMEPDKRYIILNIKASVSCA